MLDGTWRTIVARFRFDIQRSDISCITSLFLAVRASELLVQLVCVLNVLSVFVFGVFFAWKYTFVLILTRFDNRSLLLYI